MRAFSAARVARPGHEVILLPALSGHVSGARPVPTLCHTESVCHSPGVGFRSHARPTQSGVPAPRHRAGHGERRGARGGPFGAVIVRDGKIVGEGANSVTAVERPNGPRRSQRHSRSRQGPRNLHSRRLRALHQLRALSHVPGRGLLGAPRRHLLWSQRRRCGPRRLRRRVPIRRVPQRDSQRKLRATQLLGEEAWASFAAWIASPNKIEY